MGFAQMVVSLEHHKEKVMGKPQTEDGYTRIANELLEAIVGYDFSARHLKVIFAVIRKTYGYHKKADEIGLSQLRDMTGIDRSHVSRAINELAAMRVLIVTEGNNARTISLNKSYKEWVLPSQQQLPNQQLLPKSVAGVALLALQVLPDQQPQNTYTKERKESVRAPEEKLVSGTGKRVSKSDAQQDLPEPDFGGDELKKSWADFVAHRAGTKKPLTVLAATKNLQVLREADQSGFCPVALCDKAIASGWQGIYAPKAGDKRKPDSSAPAKIIGGMKVGKNWC